MKEQLTTKMHSDFFISEKQNKAHIVSTIINRVNKDKFFDLKKALEIYPITVKEIEENIKIIDGK